MNILSEYPQETCAPTEVKASGPVDNLRQQKASLEARLAKVNEALAALEANPEVARVLQLVGRALY